MQFPRMTQSTGLKVLLVAALVAVLLPVCAMPLCGPMGTMSMGGGFAGLLDCGEMYFPSDAPGAVLVQILTLMLVAVFVAFVVPDATVSAVGARAFSAPTGEPPEPPDDPLRGRLII